MAVLASSIWFCAVSVVANLFIRRFAPAFLVSAGICILSMELMRRSTPLVPFRDLASIFFGALGVLIALAVTLAMQAIRERRSR